MATVVETQVETVARIVDEPGADADGGRKRRAPAHPWRPPRGPLLAGPPGRFAAHFGPSVTSSGGALRRLET